MRGLGKKGLRNLKVGIMGCGANRPDFGERNSRREGAVTKSDSFHVGVGHPIRKDKGIFNMGRLRFVLTPV